MLKSGIQNIKKINGTHLVVREATLLDHHQLLLNNSVACHYRIYQQEV